MKSTLKIGTIDGLSFEKSRSHQQQSLRGGYNNMRSHGYAITRLCKYLGADNLAFSVDEVNEDTNVAGDPLDDLEMSVKYEDTVLSVCTHSEKCKYGILVQTLVDPKYIHRLYEFVDSVDKLYIYSSDYEYELRENTFNLKFLFEFMRDPGIHKPLVDKIKSKLVVAFCGWYHISRITPSLIGIPTAFVPQVINPNLIHLRSNHFSIFDRPYDGFFMGMNEDNLDFMKMSNNKKFLSVQYRDFSLPHTDYRNVTQIQQAGICMDLTSLISFGKLCRFHCITNSWKNLYPTLKENSDMLVNQTFKIFEAYYAGMYPINPAQDWKAANLLMDCSPEEYKSLQKDWRKKFEDNYNYPKYDHIIKLHA